MRAGSGVQTAEGDLERAAGQLLLLARAEALFGNATAARPLADEALDNSEERLRARVCGGCLSQVPVTSPKPTP